MWWAWVRKLNHASFCSVLLLIAKPVCLFQLFFLSITRQEVGTYTYWLTATLIYRAGPTGRGGGWGGGGWQATVVGSRGEVEWRMTSPLFSCPNSSFCERTWWPPDTLTTKTLSKAAILQATRQLRQFVTGSLVKIQKCSLWFNKGLFTVSIQTHSSSGFISTIKKL